MNLGWKKFEFCQIRSELTSRVAPKEEEYLAKGLEVLNLESLLNYEKERDFKKNCQGRSKECKINPKARHGGYL